MIEGGEAGLGVLMVLSETQGFKKGVDISLNDASIECEQPGNRHYQRNQSTLPA